MSFFALLFWLVVLAGLAILTHRKMPNDAGFIKTLIIGVPIVAACVLVANAFGFIDLLHEPVPRLTR